MACNDTTPWSTINHPYTVNRLRVTSGGATSQSTGKWVKETTSSTTICGYIGSMGAKNESLSVVTLRQLGAGFYEEGDQYFVCSSECDVELNDLIEIYEDEAGDSKTNWRVLTKLKTLQAYKNLRGTGRNYWLVRRG